jgi:hypothetical protein
VTIGNYGVIFDIENPKKITEIHYLDTINQFMKRGEYVQTGFNLHCSQTDQEEGFKYVMREYVHSNLHNNLLFHRSNKLWEGEQEAEDIMTGIIFRTASYVDLCELQQIVDHIQNNQKLEDIDMDTVVATFEGHTIFSLFFD